MPAAARLCIESKEHGAYIGAVELVDVISFSKESWQSLKPHHLVATPLPPRAFGWILKNPKRLVVNIASRGRLGLCEVPKAVLGTPFAETQA